MEVSGRGTNTPPPPFAATLKSPMGGNMRVSHRNADFLLRARRRALSQTLLSSSPPSQRSASFSADTNDQAEGELTSHEGQPIKRRLRPAFLRPAQTFLGGPRLLNLQTFDLPSHISRDRPSLHKANGLPLRQGRRGKGGADRFKANIVLPRQNLSQQVLSPRTPS